MAEIAGRHKKTVAQVALRFLIQRGIIVIPKSARKEQMQENFMFLILCWMMGICRNWPEWMRRRVHFFHITIRRL